MLAVANSEGRVSPWPSTRLGVDDPMWAQHLVARLAGGYPAALSEADRGRPRRPRSLDTLASGGRWPIPLLARFDGT